MYLYNQNGQKNPYIVVDEPIQEQPDGNLHCPRWQQILAAVGHHLIRWQEKVM